MKESLFSILIFNNSSGNIVNREYSLSSFGYFTRSHIQGILETISQRLVENIDSNVYQEFIHHFDSKESCKFSAKSSSDLTAIATTVTDYPSSTLKLLLTDALKGASLKELISEYQDFKKKDILAQIQDELAQTETILTKTVESVLGRGEKIDELINSADNLSFQTKSLYRLSRKQNKRCCGVM